MLPHRFCVKHVPVLVFIVQIPFGELDHFLLDELQPAVKAKHLFDDRRIDNHIKGRNSVLHDNQVLARANDVLHGVELLRGYQLLLILAVLDVVVKLIRVGLVLDQHVQALADFHDILFQPLVVDHVVRSMELLAVVHHKVLVEQLVIGLKPSAQPRYAVAVLAMYLQLLPQRIPVLEELEQERNDLLVSFAGPHNSLVLLDVQELQKYVVEVHSELVQAVQQQQQT